MDALRAGVATRVGEVTLIPLYLIQATSIEQPDFCWLNGSAEPFAVVFVEPDGVRAIGLDASELAVEALVAKVPGLEVAIQSGAAR